MTRLAPMISFGVAALAAIVAVPAAAQTRTISTVGKTVPQIEAEARTISTVGKTVPQIEAEARAAARSVCADAAQGTVLPLAAFSACMQANMANVRAQLKDPAYAQAFKVQLLAQR